MWVPKAVAEWFQISKESVDALREELAATKAERDVLRNRVLFVENSFEWLRVKVNALEHERNGLLEKAYNIKLPVPELLRAPTVDMATQNFSFDDIGDDLAKKLGLPVHGN